MKKGLNYHHFLLGLSAILLSLVLIVLTAVFYRDSVSETRELLLSSTETNHGAVYHKIQDELVLLNSTGESFQNNPHITELVQKYADARIARVELFDVHSDLYQILSARLYVSEYIDAIFLTTPARSLSIAKQQQAYRSNPYMNASLTEDVLFYRDEEGSMRLSFALPEVPGCSVHMEISPHLMERLMDSVEYAVLEDDRGKMYFSPDMKAMGLTEEQILAMLESGEDTGIMDGYCYARSSFPEMNLNWRFLYVMDSNAYFYSYRMIVFSGILAFAAAMAVSMLLSHVIGRQVLRPLYGLIKRIRNFKEGERKVRKEQPGLGLREGVFINTIVSLAAGVLAFVVLFSIESAQIRRSHRNSLNQATLTVISGSLESNLDKMRNSLMITAVDPRVQEYVKKNEPTAQMQEEMEQAMRESVNLHPGACTVFLYDLGEKLKYQSNAIAGSVFYKQEELAQWFYTRDQFSNPVIAIYFGIPGQSAWLCGVYDFSILENQLFMLAGRNENIFLQDEKGEILIGNGPNRAVSFLSSPLEHTEWAVGIADEGMDIGAQMMDILQEHMILIIAMLLTAILLASVLSTVQLAPLSRLSAAMRKIRQGSLPDMDALSRPSAFNEVNELSQSFIDMEDRIEMLIDDLVISRNRMLALENAKKNAEINALQMQITPHFLSNSIMLIASRIKEGKPDEAISMLFTMNKLFRYGIARRELVISVREEWEYAQAYALIMAARKHLLQFEWDIPQEALDRPTVRLILQPLIENAIYHGNRQDGLPTVIRVCCRITESTTVFTVEDNGPGISPERLLEVQNKLSEIPGGYAGSSIGLYNVQSRVRLYCGKEYGVEIASREEGGARVTLTVPSQMRPSVLSTQ